MRRITNICFLCLLLFFSHNLALSQFKSSTLFKSASSNTKIVGTIENATTKLFLYQEQNSIKAKNDSGSLVWQKKFDRTIKTITSDDRRQIGVIIHNSLVNENFDFQVMNQNGELRYDFQIRLQQDDLLPIATISNLGQSAIFRPEMNHFTLISKDGNIIYNAPFTLNLESGLEKSIHAAFSKDGNYLAIIGMQKPATFDEPNQLWISGNPVFMLFNQKGEKLWAKMLPGSFSQAMAISQSGKFIATVSHDFTGIKQQRDSYFLLFDGTGNILYEDDYFPKSVIFSEDEKFLLRHNRRDIQLVDLSLNKTTFKKTFAEKFGSIESIAINRSANKIFCLTGNHGFHENIFQFEQARLWDIDISTGKEKFVMIENLLTLPISIEYQDKKQNLLLMSENAVIELEQNEK